MRRNRRRIVGLAAASLLNFWIAAFLFVVAVTVGAAIAFTIESFVDGDFNVVMDLIRGVRKAATWATEAGWFSEVTTTRVVLGIVVLTALAALRLLWGRVSLVERRVTTRTGAQSATDQRVADILEGVAIAAGVPAPGVSIVADPALNSYSIGRKPESASIVVTTGLVEALSRDELEAVLAYELSRIASFDTALSTWTAGLTGRTIELYQETGKLLAKLALIVPTMLARRLRARTLRRQAGQRDILALNFTRHPEALISALEKIDADTTPVAAAGAMTAPLWLKWPSWNAADSKGIPRLTDRVQELRTLVAA
jgi:heat shock protein HtpX